MKKGVKKLRAILLSFLIITIPIFSAGALAAATVKEVKVYGDEGTPGFISESYTSITYDVLAEWDGGEVTTDNIGLEYADDFYPFSAEYCDSSSCTNLEFSPENGEHTYRCTCTALPLTRKTIVTAALSDGSSILDKKQTTVIPDVLPPSVELVSAQQSGDKMQVRFKAKDFACEDSSCANICSGIQKVVITSDGQTAHEAIEGFNGCGGNLMEAQFSLSGEGEKEICVQAFDKLYSGIGNVLHNSSLDCASAMTDFNQPSICPEGTFSVERNGHTINWVSEEGPNSIFTADVLVKIIDQTDVEAYADISSLHGDDKYADPNFAGNYLNLSCSFQGAGSSTCKISGKELHITELSPVIHVSATDSQGNTFEKDCTGSFQIDNTPPELVKIGTDRCRGDVCYVSPGRNNLVITINDADAGFSNRWVYLDVSSLNRDFEGASAQVRECHPTQGDLWECTGPITVERLAEREPTVSVLPISVDDAGNSFSGSGELAYDETPPIFNSVVAYPSDDVNRQYLASGDDAIIVANVSDASGISSAWADLSALAGPGYENEIAVCNEETTSNYLCEWLIPDVNGPLENQAILFFANDTAGNTNSNPYEYQISVLGHESGETNYWRIGEVKISPKKIDKLTTNFVQQFAFVQIQLVPRTTDVETLAMSLECSDMQTTDLQSAPSLLNDQRGSTNPFIRLDLRQKQIDTDEIPIDCDLSVYSRKGNTVTDDPQVLEVSGVAIEFYNEPIGQLPQNIAEEIQGVKESDLVSGNFIPNMRDTFKFMNKLCTIQQMIHKVSQVIGLSWSAVAPTEKTGIGKTIAESLRIPSLTSSKIYKFAAKLFEWMCAVATCQVMDKIMVGAGVGEGTSQFYNDVVFRNPEKSLYSSIATLCLPGIISNLEKARQAECEYALCLQNRFPREGTPPVVCSMTRQYKWCVIKGEQWAGIPFVGFLNDMLQAIRHAFTNWGSVVFAAAAVACHTLPSAIVASTCNVASDIKSKFELASYLTSAWHSVGSDDDPKYCEELGVEE